MTGIDASMFELFREEVKSHADTLATGLVALDANPTDSSQLESLMRAAHSIKGAARIINIDTAVRLAHVMEDALVAAQEGKIRLQPNDIDALLKGTDVLAGLSLLAPDTVAAWEANNGAAVSALEPVFVAMAEGKKDQNPTPQPPPLNGEGEKEAARGFASDPPSVLAKPRAASDSPFPPLPAFEPASIPAESFALRPDHSMLDLFREETRGHLSDIAKALPALATDPTASEPAQEALKQLRGAARLVKCEAVAALAGALSNFLRSAREGKCELSPLALDWARHALATLAGALATDDETFAAWVEATKPALATIADVFARGASHGPHPPAPSPRGEGEKEIRGKAEAENGEKAAKAVVVPVPSSLPPPPRGEGAGG